MILILNKSIKILLKYLLGPIVFIALVYSIYNQIEKQADLELRWQQIQFCWQNPLLYFVIILMLFNWGIEAIKWQVLMRPIENLSNFNAFKSILAGCSITMITPNRIAEYGGRMLFVKPGNKIQSISVSILGSMSQLLITFLFGAIGLWIMKDNFQMTDGWLNHITLDAIWAISLLTALFLMLLFFKVNVWSNFFSKFPFIKKKREFFFPTKKYTYKELIKILSLSTLRYLVFLTQYIFMLKLMQVNIRFDVAICLISFFFLLMAIAPTFGFIELPIRAKLLTLILGLYSNNILGIQFVSVGIWFINLIFPAILGSFIILKTNFIKK